MSAVDNAWARSAQVGDTRTVSPARSAERYVLMTFCKTVVPLLRRLARRRAPRGCGDRPPVDEDLAAAGKAVPADTVAGHRVVNVGGRQAVGEGHLLGEAASGGEAQGHRSVMARPSHRSSSQSRRRPSTTRTAMPRAGGQPALPDVRPRSIRAENTPRSEPREAKHQVGGIVRRASLPPFQGDIFWPAIGEEPRGGYSSTRPSRTSRRART